MSLGLPFTLTSGGASAGSGGTIPGGQILVSSNFTINAGNVNSYANKLVVLTTGITDITIDLPGDVYYTFVARNDTVSAVTVTRGANVASVAASSHRLVTIFGTSGIGQISLTGQSA